MIKINKWKAILSSIVILLPMLFGLAVWNQLPDSMVSHWGADGVADGSASKGFMVFGMPLILLGIQWLMLLLEAAVGKNSAQNPKIVGIMYGIIPALSLVVHVFI